ncbi:MAG: ACR3 family arsenite efflux transporter [Crocinitomicaceae bacterium]
MKLSFLDKYLTLWIFSAMLIGVLIGVFSPDFSSSLEQLSEGTTNIPLAIGLILMMYPPLAKVNYAKIPTIFKNYKPVLLSLAVTWIFAPLFMFALANLFLSEYPEYHTGLILIGIAPCIAMVIVWNELAGGNREYIAALIGINSLLQVFFYASYAYFYITYLPEKLGMKNSIVDIEMTQIAKTVFIYLGIPFTLGAFSRTLGIKIKGQEWYEQQFLPKISPITLISLLLTIIFMFSLKGEMIVKIPFDVVRISIPLILFFGVMFILMFFLAKKMKTTYDVNMALSFTATGNNFELAIAVSIGVFGINSGEAFAGVIGPLIEVPALILLVKLAFWLKGKYYNNYKPKS